MSFVILACFVSTYNNNECLCGFTCVTTSFVILYNTCRNYKSFYGEGVAHEYYLSDTDADWLGFLKGRSDFRCEFA